MRRALALAGRSAGQVSPNPLVGAVLVKGDRIMGEGFHTYQGKDHAEIIAIGRAGDQARGATLYINLEPCCHQGRTPPCVDRLIEAGISRAFVAVSDPNPRVAGKGIEKLRLHGVEVQEGVLRRQALHVNEKFFHWVQTGLPFVLLKLALTLDGKIATRTGDSQWITGQAARRRSHRLRYEYDAIAVGVGTVLKDNPRLDVRWKRLNPITKVILDSRLCTPAQARLFESGDRVIIFHAAAASGAKRQNLSGKSELVGVPIEQGLLSWGAVLAELGRRQISSLIVEGGSAVAASALRCKVVQKVNFFYGPRLIGESGLSGIGDLRTDRLQDSIVLKGVRLKKLDSDFLVEAYLTLPAQSPE